VVATLGLKSRGVHLYPQPSTTLRAKSRWIEFAPTRDIRMIARRRATPAAVGTHNAQMAFDSAPIGI